MATCINWEEIFKRDKSFGVRLLLEHSGESSIWILEDSFFLVKRCASAVTSTGYMLRAG